MRRGRRRRRRLNKTLHHAPVRAGPSFVSQRLLERDLPLRERPGILETLDALGAVGLGDDQLVESVGRLARFTAHELTLLLEDPNHRSPAGSGRSLKNIRGTNPRSAFRHESLATVNQTARPPPFRRPGTALACPPGRWL